MIVATPMPENYQEKFREFEGLAAGRDLPWLQKLRADAFARFCEVGFPTTHEEDWRFTNVGVIARTPFEFAPESRFRLSLEDLKPYRVANAALQMVFVNGRFAPELSFPGRPHPGVEVGSLAEKIAAEGESGELESANRGSFEPHFTAYPDLWRDAFSALNTAFWEDGAYVRILKGTVVKEPICLLFVSVGEDIPFMSHPRNLLLVEENSQAEFAEEYVSLGDGAVLCNTITALAAGDHAVVSHTMIEREHAQAFNVSTLRVQQGRGTDVASHSVLLGGKLVRNNVHPVMAGEGGECRINGLFIGSGHEHLDNYMLVEHASPRCASRQFYNGILAEHASGVFHGRIIVHPDAQKTDAKQTNRNLLLSDDAQIDTKPQLEIYADDVKCTHGATIGQMDADALFYLRSRGIDEAAARRLLIAAFAGECVDRMKPGPIRRHVEALIDNAVSQLVHGAQGNFSGDPKHAAGNWEEIG